LSDPIDPNAPQDREHFGEASLGEAQSETNPDPLDPDEESLDPNEAAPDDELTDVPAIEPDPSEATVSEEEEAAAAEAGAIGGVTGQERLSDEERPLAEAGEGVAEGFEQAEDDLIEAASHGDPAGNPLGDRFTPEEAESEGLAEYGEADNEHVSENTEDDH
jgi:hypothetical protein